MKSYMVGATLSAVLLCTQLSLAGSVFVGDGPNTGAVVVDFQDGYSVKFILGFTDPMSHTDALLFIKDANVGLTVHLNAYEIEGVTSYYLDGLTYDDGTSMHSNIGYGYGENWWHFWVIGDDGWYFHNAAPPMFDAGSAHGWVYGTAAPPSQVPEPTTLTLLAAAGAAVALRRRKAKCA